MPLWLLLGDTAEPARDGGVIGRDTGEGFERQPAAKLLGHVTCVDCRQHLAIIGGIDQHDDTLMVLGCRPNHGRPADIDILDRGGEISTTGDGALEGIEIAHQDIDGADAVLLECRHVRCVVLAREQAAMDPRMQCLDPPIQNFRLFGDIGDLRDRQAGLHERLGGAARRHQLYAA